METRRYQGSTEAPYISWLPSVDNLGMAYRDKDDPRNREAKRRHYYSNREQYYARNRAKKRTLRTMLVEAKSQPCMDCGGVFPPVAMDFDHRDPRTKLWPPSHLPASGSFRVMREELAKCDLVCSNCHRLREEARRMARATENLPYAMAEEPPNEDGSVGALSADNRTVSEVTPERQ